MTCLIIAGGMIFDKDIIKNRIQNLSFDYVIAADSGYDNAKILGINVDEVVGDMDSILEVPNIKATKLIPEKDDTDLKVCVEIAVEYGVKSIVFLAVTGGRLDHFFANVSILEYLNEKNVFAMIIDEQNMISYLSGEKNYKNTSKYVSIVPISDEICLTTLNMKYEATDLTVKRTNMISVSNEALSEDFSIKVDGKALIIQSD